MVIQIILMLVLVGLIIWKMCMESSPNGDPPPLPSLVPSVPTQSAQQLRPDDPAGRLEQQQRAYANEIRELRKQLVLERRRNTARGTLMHGLLTIQENFLEHTQFFRWLSPHLTLSNPP